MKSVSAQAQAMLGRAYPITSASKGFEVDHRTGLVGKFFVGTRGDGRVRTVFVPSAHRAGTHRSVRRDPVYVPVSERYAKVPRAMSKGEAPPSSFKSPRGRLFTLGHATHTNARFAGDTFWSDDWAVFLNGKEVASLSRNLAYGLGARGKPRWQGSLSKLQWGAGGPAPTGLGFDVSGCDTAKECLRRMGRNIDQVLDWREGKTVRSIHSKTGSYTKGRADPRHRARRDPARRPRVDSKAWRSTPAADAQYRAVRAEAQRMADETGYDRGLEANDLFKTFRHFALPQKKNRSGHELQCEVVSPMNVDKTQPGHGYRRDDPRRRRRSPRRR